MKKEVRPEYTAFFDVLEKSGLVEGKNLEVIRLSANGVAENYDQVAAEAVALEPDVILSLADRPSKALNKLTSQIPIVVTVTDPVLLGIAETIARPGRNFTGVMVNSDISVWKKRVEYLKLIVPEMKEIFQVAARSYWDSVVGNSLLEAAKENGCSLIGPPVESPHHEAEYRYAFAQASKKAQGCIVSASIENSGNRQIIVDLAREYRLPAFYQSREYVDLGGLIAHDIGVPDLYKHAGEQIVQVLKGTWPGSIPFYQPYQLRLIINLRAAEEIGVRIPQSLIARADETID